MVIKRSHMGVEEVRPEAFVNSLDLIRSFSCCRELLVCILESKG